MVSLTEFLFPAPAPRTTGGIIRWWEGRRLAYNGFVGGAGLVTVGVVSVLGSFLQGRIWVLPWQPILAFGVMANLCYLFGPAAEILIERIWGRTVLPIGPSLYRIGLTFSVGLALFPSLLVTILTMVQIVFDSNFP